MFSKNKRLIKTSALALLLVVIVFGVLIYFTNQRYVMSGPSMEPAINDKQTIKIRKLDFANIKNGDIVAINDPSGKTDTLIKRVIGLPGDTVQAFGGIIVVKKANGDDYKPYGDQINESLNGLNSKIDIDKVYLLGDNLSNSYDSRFFGQVSSDKFIGVVELN